MPRYWTQVFGQDRLPQQFGQQSGEPDNELSTSNCWQKLRETTESDNILVQSIGHSARHLKWQQSLVSLICSIFVIGRTHFSSQCLCWFWSFHPWISRGRWFTIISRWCNTCWNKRTRGWTCSQVRGFDCFHHIRQGFFQHYRKRSTLGSPRMIWVCLKIGYIPNEIAI